MFIPDLFDLMSRHAFITGASGGLGRHFAATLARYGAVVTVAAHRAEALAETVLLIEDGDGQVHAAVMDVTETASIEAALDAAQRRFGPVTILVNDADVSMRKPSLEVEESEWDRVFDTNLKGLWLVTRAVCRRQVREGVGGSVVNIASIGGLGVMENGTPYAVSKAGVVHLTKNLALEWAPHGVRVNALALGFFRTDLNATFLNSDAGKAVVRQRVPQGRTRGMEELEGPLLLLASNAGSFMTGCILMVDGGHLLSSLM